MHIFICKAVGGKIVPQQSNKKEFFEKLINSYQELNMSFTVSIEPVQKNINEAQIALYRAFILKASEHFGNSFQEMESLLKSFYPIEDIGSYKPITNWSTKELTNFIDEASALLSEQGFNFEK